MALSPVPRLRSVMMFDLFRHFKENPKYNKLVGSEYLFTEYQCPVQTDQFQFVSELNFISFVISGKKDWFVSGEAYPVREGDAIFVRKGAYTTRQYFDVEHCMLTFFISDDFIRNFFRENEPAASSGPGSKTTYSQIIRLDVNTPLKSMFFGMFNYLKMGKDVPRRLVELKFNELMFNIVLNPRNHELSHFFRSLDQSRKTSLDYVMTNHFQYDLEMEDFARLSGRSLSTFKRDFKASYRVTPGKWLTAKRLEYAKNLLINSDLNVNEVCFESGFRNTTHFNRAFKEKYSLPPGQFRLSGKRAGHDPCIETSYEKQEGFLSVCA